MAALLNRRRYMGGGSSLPYDAEIEYLESTGTQWIDTGVVLNQDSVIDLTFSITVTQNNAIVGARSAYKNNDYSWHILNTEYHRRNYSGYENTSQSKINEGVIVNYKEEANILYLNGAIAYSFPYVNFQTPGNAFIFTLNNNGRAFNLAKARIYRCLINGINNSVDFIPVRIGTTGYMYDKVSGQLFGNSGAGSFTLGPDKT